MLCKRGVGRRLIVSRQFGKRHPKSEGEHWHDRVRRDQFQLYDGVFVQSHRFAGGCEGKRDNERCHNSQKNWIRIEILCPNQTEWI